MFRFGAKTLNLSLKQGSIRFQSSSLLKNFQGAKNEFHAVRCLSNQSNGRTDGQQHSWSQGHESRQKWSLMLGGCALLGGTAFLALKKDEVTEATQSLREAFTQRATVHASAVIKSDIPDSVNYLLIGGGTASYSAAKTLKKQSPKDKILIITEESNLPYSRPPLSKQLWMSEDGANLKFKGRDGKPASIFYEDPSFYVPAADMMNSKEVGYKCNRRVVKLDIPNQKAVLDDGHEIKYDRCLIATGGKPKNIPVFMNADPKVQERVSLFRTAPDFQELDALTKKVKSVAIIGGGFLGSELACAIAAREGKSGMKVTQMFPGTGCFGRILPEYLSDWTTDKVRAEGVDVKPGTNVTSASYANGQVALKLDSGQTLLVDHVVVCAGLNLNTDLAKTSGLEVDEVRGGYKANAELEARTNVFVAGDVASYYDIELGRRRVEHHDHATLSGRIAAENMMGAAKPFTEQSMFWSGLGRSVGFQAVGKIDSKLATLAVYTPATSNQPVVVKETEKVVERFPFGGGRRRRKGFGWFNKKVIQNPDDFKKGVIFFLEDDKVVGVIVWNIFNKLGEARKVMQQTKPKDITAIAKQFGLT
ncbi:apoptosis-inducing factor 1, mitochondrial-like [Lineus longissimus]|uniref:apoptosis-inducing factor 1, mitochondrial-like n=1 Tax=Lineus longissimus TaxID=88925 RepID=UPI002B4F9D7C